MSIAWSGTREFAIYRLEPQVNITSVIINGITLHAISRPILLCSASGFNCSAILLALRRYLTAKYKMKRKIETVKNAVTPVRKKYRRSTPVAMVEATSGKSGNQIMLLACG